MDLPGRDTPLILVVDDQEWSARSFESVLREPGFAVLRAYTGGQAVALAAKINPDLAMVDFTLPDMLGSEACRRLRQTPTIGQAVPIIITTSGMMPRSQRLEAFEAGAWDVLELPVDARELITRVRNFVKAKAELDEVRARTLLDAPTGLYNFPGLQRRSVELLAEASRRSFPISCLSVGRHDSPSAVGQFGDQGGLDDLDRAEGAAAEIGRALNEICRASDVIARIGRTNFVVLAVNTDEGGSEELVTRILEAVANSAGPRQRDDLDAVKIGCCVVDPTDDLSTTALEGLLEQANAALARAWADPGRLSETSRYGAASN